VAVKVASGPDVHCQLHHQLYHPLQQYCYHHSAQLWQLFLLQVTLLYLLLRQQQRCRLH
jgi:hypothetical protein